jgi:DNA polymerase III delta prime subunit
VVLDTGRQTGSPIDDLVPAAHRIGKAIESVIEGKAGRDPGSRLTVLLAEGHLLIEDVPGVGKTMLAKALARVHRRHGAPSPVHARPAAQRHHRRQRLQPGAARFRVQARTGVRQHRARRRDQPGLAEDAVRAARIHGRAAGHRGRHHVSAARNAVHGDRHPEPGGDGGHLPAPRGPAGPVHRPHLARVTRLPAAEREMLDNARLQVTPRPAQAPSRGPATCRNW